jgi:hypothetical protein
VRLEHLLSGDLELRILNFEFEILNPKNLGLRSAINLIYSKLIEGKLQASSLGIGTASWMSSKQPEASSLKRTAKKEEQ